MTWRALTANPENCTLAELDVAIRACSSLRSHSRLLALRALLLGQGAGAVAAIFGVSRRTLDRWIVRFNAQGIDGLIERPRLGAPRKISASQTQRYRELIKEPAQADRTHWTAQAFHGYLREELQHEVGYRTVVRWLHENNFRLKVPQPWPDRQDETLRQAFVLQLRHWMNEEGVEIWFADEMGVEGDPRPRRRWALKGQKARVTKNGDHVRMNVMGMVCPRTGELIVVEFSHSDRECFQAFLDHANVQRQSPRPRQLLICDNASWHKCKSLNWGVFEPVYLPPYSPDLNPIERLWLLIKAHWFADFVAKSHAHLIERLDQALCWAINRATDNVKACTIKTEL